MKNITFSADEALIESAREQAKADNSTLNEQFRLWLAAYAKRLQLSRFDALMADIGDKYDTGGRRFTRDEMNER
jgi:hypothetical protein